jgi:hypothetical protein
VNVSTIGIQNLFDLFGTLGKAIRSLFGQKLEIKGGVNVSLTIELGTVLEGLIRDIITDKESDVEPIEFFTHAVQDLVKDDEKKFIALSQLKVADVTLGTEAIWNADSVPDDMREIFVRYVNLNTLAASPDEVSDSKLLPTMVTDVLRSWHTSTANGGQTLAEKYGHGKIVPPSL